MPSFSCGRLRVSADPTIGMGTYRPPCSEIVLSRAVADKLDPELRLEQLGERSLKNVGEPVACFTLR